MARAYTSNLPRKCIARIFRRQLEPRARGGPIKKPRKLQATAADPRGAPKLSRDNVRRNELSDMLVVLAYHRRKHDIGAILKVLR